MAATVVVAGTVLSCGRDTAAPSGPATTIAFDRDSLLLDAINDAVQLSVSLQDARGRASADPVAWSSANSSVATVDADGRVRSAGAGRTTIRATAGAAVDSLVVRVAPIARAVAFTADTLRLATIGRSLSPTVEIRDRNGVPLAAPLRQWQSRDPGIATVSAEGALTAIAPGATTVVLSVDAQRDSAVVVVRPVAARMAVTIDAPVLDVGGTALLSTLAADSGGTAITTGSVASFAVRDPVVASIEGGNGLIRGLSAGTTTLLATAIDDATLRDSAVLLVAAPGWAVGRAIVTALDPAGVPAGTTLAIRVTIDASRLAQPGALAAAEATLRWDPTVLALDSLRSAANAAVNAQGPGAVALAYAAADAASGGTIDLATLFVRVVGTAALREAGLALSTPYRPVDLDLMSVAEWAALSDRIRTR